MNEEVHANDVLAALTERVAMLTQELAVKDAVITSLRRRLEETDDHDRIADNGQGSPADARAGRPGGVD